MTVPPTDAARPDDFEVRLDSRALKSASVQGSMLIGLSQIFKLFLQIGSQVALARLLFPRDFGLVAMVYPVVSFAAIFADIGFGEAVIQRERLDQPRVSALFWISLGLSCGLALVVAALSPVIAWVYHEPRLVALMAVAAIAMPLGALGGVQGALITRQMKFGIIVRIEIIGAIITTAATVAAAWHGMGYWSLVVGSLIGQAASAGMNWWASDWRPSRPALSHSLIDDLKFGSNVTGYNLATFLTQSGDNVIIGLLNGQFALGIYDRSYRLVVQPIGQLLAPVGRVAIPLLSRLNNDPAEYRKVFLEVVRAIVISVVPGMLVCVLFGRDVVQVLLGPRWTAAGDIFGWIAIAGVTGCVQATALWGFISQARMRGLRAFTLTTSFFNLSAFLIGSIWGIRGVAISLALIYTFITTPLIIYGSTRSGPVSLRDLLRCGAPFVVAAAIAAALLLGFRLVEPATPLLRILAALAIAYTVFLAIGLGPPAERRKLVALVGLLRTSR